MDPLGVRLWLRFHALSGLIDPYYNNVHLDPVSNSLQNVWVSPFPQFSYLNEWSKILSEKNWGIQKCEYLLCYCRVLLSGDLASSLVSGIWVIKIVKGL